MKNNIKFEDLTQKCTNCDGTGWEECCNGHMCSGTKQCYSCKGMKIEPKPEFRKIINFLKVFI